MEIEVVAVGTVDHGVLVVTQIDQDNLDPDGGIIERFWDSLKIGL